MPEEDKRLLSLDEIDQSLSLLQGWQRENSLLKKEFTFSNFREITSFLNHLVQTITLQNHHPDFAVDTTKKQIQLTVTTHSKKAITRADLLFVQTLEAWKKDTV
jgi:pterin-4a-carbinolamine dehydratase